MFVVFFNFVVVVVVDVGFLFFWFFWGVGGGCCYRFVFHYHSFAKWNISL